MILNTIEKTQEEIKKDIANEFVNYLNNVVTGTDNRMKGLAGKFWENPAIISEALGTQVGKLFTLLGSLETLLAQYDETFVPFAVPYEYTINADGSVTIGNKIEDEVIEDEVTEE